MNQLLIRIRIIENKFHNALVQLLKETAFSDVTEFSQIDLNNYSEDQDFQEVLNKNIPRLHSNPHFWSSEVK